MAKPIKIWDGSQWVDVAINTPDISNHIADTTDVHGISNTANLVYTNDSRLTDSRTPTAHASSHGSAGSDPITIAQSQVTNLTTDLSAKAPLASPTFTGTPIAPTAVAGTNSTQIATTAYADTSAANAAAALVDAAPSTLDTLNELAAALGDDPNFATTVTNSIATKAPLASPTFTGTVVLPSTTSIGNVSSTELGYLDGVTSAIQTQINAKANSASPTLTGTVSLDSQADLVFKDGSNITEGRIVSSSGIFYIQAGTSSGDGTASISISRFGTTATSISSLNIYSDTTTFSGRVVAPVSTNQQTGTAYTLILSDQGKAIEMNNAAANTLTVPTDASVNFPVGTVIDIFQTGAGQTTVGGAGVTINARPGLKLSGQWATATLIKRAANTWLLTGSLSA